MNEFEKEYYESPDFWNDGAVGDDSNMERILNTINIIPNDVKSLVDIGCGNGVFLNKMNELKSNITTLGIDRSNEALKYVIGNSQIGDIVDVPLASNTYDCVSCLQVLEHIPVTNYEKALSELVRVSSKYIIVGVPFEEKTENNKTTCPQCKSSFNSDLHVRSYNSKTIESLFADYNMVCKESLNVVVRKKYILLEFAVSLRERFRGNKKNNDFRSPICPICGYTNSKKEAFKPVINQNKLNNNGYKQKALNLLKFISPTRTVKGYWIIALYEKN